MTDAKSWDEKFSRVAAFAATWSKDPKRKVGAAIADVRQRVAGVGYNGLPCGVYDTESRLANSETRKMMTVHAEVNAILNSPLSAARGGTLYSTVFPCASCAGIIIQAGITRIVCPPPEEGSSWAHSWEVAATMLRETGVQIYMRD